MKSALILLLFSSVAWAHQAHHKEEKGIEEPPPIEEKQINKAALEKIKKWYQEGPENIFRQKCFDCHSTKTQYPWYYKIPGVKQLVDDDIREGLNHLDMTHGFPFEGHGTPKEDLEAIQKSVQEDTMPPWRYKAMNWNAWLSEEDKKVIVDWVRQSQDLLY